MRRQRPSPKTDPIAETLLELLTRPDYRPVPQRELLHLAQVSRADRPAARRSIRQLIESGRIRKIAAGRLAVGADDVAAPRRLEHRELTGAFFARGRGGSVRSFDPSVAEPIEVPVALRGGAEDKQAVVFELLPGPSGAGLQGKVVEVLGHLDEPGTDVRVISRKHGLPAEFPADALEQARALPARIEPDEARHRERFDDPPPVTIDGETARDFDDAIAVQETARGGFRLFVHIADVAHFVEPGSALDLEARRRGTSVYFPDRVFPMFPEKLSNDLCSLRPGEDRFVQTVVLDHTATGALTRVRFADGVIRSRARLTYTAVGGLLEGARRGHGVPAEVVPMLRTADRLRELLEKRRHARGSIDFDLPEPQILLDVEGVMTGITVEPRNRAHLLIEEFMLAANDAVAEHLEQHRRNCLYRVHEPPDPAKVEALANLLEGYGLRLSTREGAVAPGDIQRVLDRVEGRPEARVISQIALRTMKQARYSVENTGHFGLASPSYCHFTSPIRRYPDLVVHRLLRAQRGGAAPGDVADRAVLETLADGCSELERRAEAAERELLLWKKVAFIERRVGDAFDGVVTGVTRFGLFVQLVENLVEGLVRIELLGDEWFEFDERKFALIGSRTGRTFRLGDLLRVRVDRVDRLLQRVDLSPVDGDGSPRPARRGLRPLGGPTPPRRREAASRRPRRRR